MPKRDECRPVTLPSGETILVRGDEPLSPQGAAALGELVEVVRAKLAAEHPADPGAQILWARVAARASTLDTRVRDAAKLAGVRPSVFSRLANGRMPDTDDLARIEAWLEASTRGATSAPEPAPGAGGSDGRA